MSMYRPASDLHQPPPACPVCGSAIEVSARQIPGTDQVVITEATCPTDVEHNARAAEVLGGRLEEWRP